jgi:uncharacterized protein
VEYLDETHLIEMVYGGAVLGAGGGGSIESGMAAGGEALARGVPRLIGIKELPPKTIIATLSIVGSVSGMSDPQQRLRHGLSLRRLGEMECASPEAVISSEVGPQPVIYGWGESAATGVPIVDAPCNGRAHPSGLMGSLGLHRHPEYVTSTVATAGGSDGRTRVELAVRSSAANASKIVRQASAGMGGPLAVARNPLPARYVAGHAAVGGLKYAQRIGKIVAGELNHGLPKMLQHLARETGGRVLAEGGVSEAALRDRGGFAVGHIRIKERDGSECDVAVCNEYLALQRDGYMLVTFPDLIVLFDRERLLPLSSPEVRVGTQVSVFGVPREHLILGSTMRDQSLLQPLERLLKRRLRNGPSFLRKGLDTGEERSREAGRIRPRHPSSGIRRFVSL